jgi:hypothetical protein
MDQTPPPLVALGMVTAQSWPSQARVRLVGFCTLRGLVRQRFLLRALLVNLLFQADLAHLRFALTHSPPQTVLQIRYFKLTDLAL